MKDATGGTCCNCGYSGKEGEGECTKREDGSHCVHWWDGVEAENGEYE